MEVVPYRERPMATRCPGHATQVLDWWVRRVLSVCQVEDGQGLHHYVEVSQLISIKKSNNISCLG